METPAFVLLAFAQASHGAHYQKQFGPMQGDLLWQVLGFIGAIVALAALAGWLFHGESQDAKRRSFRAQEETRTKRKQRKAERKKASS